MFRQALALSLLLLATAARAQQPPAAWWDRDVVEALAQAKGNREELARALRDVPMEQRPGMAFLVANMPSRDLVSLKADFLLKNVELAYQARAKMPWGRAVPEELFLNDVLPYASVTEAREPWRQEMMERCLPLVRDCKTITQAAQALNAQLFAKVKVRYSTERQRPDQAPGESMKSGLASCTGLSILLIDACRSVGIPARLAGIAKWANKPGNHTWVEIWDGGWHFTGACEHDAAGLDRAWFVGDAARAQKDSVLSAIYAASFKRTKTKFPLVWAPDVRDVYAENVTDRYTKASQPAPAKTLANEQRERIMTAARGFFDTGKKPDGAFDDLLRTHEDGVRQAVWQAYAGSKAHADMKADFDKNLATSGKHQSVYTVKRVGKKPAGGWPLFIAMHGGGGVPKPVNDSQWRQMQEYYRDQTSVPGYLYVAPRAPNDLWNGFYDDYMCACVSRIVRQFTLFGEVDADRVFLMGYSHGGYGAFYIGPKMPDHFAAVHASAAAPTPNTIAAKCLRSTPFTFMIGENDNAYGRRERCEKFAAEIALLRQAEPDAYPVTMEFKKGFGHGGLPDRDKIKDLYASRRNPVPKHVTWEPTDPHITDFFWLGVNKPARGQSLDARLAGNTLTVRTAKVESFTLWLDGRLLALDQPLALTVDGKASTHKLTPSLAALCASLQRRGDPGRAASCRVDVQP